MEHMKEELYKKRDRQDLLENTPIWTLIAKMSLPSVIGVMAYSIYNLCDTLFISQGEGINALGGVAVSFPLFLLLSAVSSTLGGGAASMMSRAFGEKDPEKAARIAANKFLVFYTTAILVTILGLVFLDPLLYVMGVTDTLLPYARSYTRIILLGAVTSTGFSNLIRAEGDSKYAMYIWVIPMSANIVLDVLFIFGLHMGVIGAALGTVLSQCMSMVMSIYFFFFSGRSILRFSLKYFRPDIRLLGEMIGIGIPSFFQMSGMSFAIIITNQFLRKYGGDLAISTYGIVNKILTFFMFPIMGLMQGIQPIIGYNRGARKDARVKEPLRKGILSAGIYGIAACLVLWFFASQIMYVFTSDQEVIRMGSAILAMIGTSIVFSGIQNIEAGYFQSIGKKGCSMILVLLNQVICFIPVMSILGCYYGQQGIWYSFPVSAALALGISTIVTVKHFAEKRA